MKEIFSKTDFPKSPGGNLFEWKEAETKFEVPEDGKYVIAITASAKNAQQNNSHDDDDLRVVIDDYEFGKYEVHDEKVSWKGFGTAASFDGASLKGGAKTVYYFIELEAGEHKLKFYADSTPSIKGIIVWTLKEGEPFDKIEEVKPSENIETDKNGIPFISLVFLAVKPKNFNISVLCESAALKRCSDGDNIKMVINGKILQNEKAPNSKTYKNFFFSGDLDENKVVDLKLHPNRFKQVENSVELWYDQTPIIKNISFELFENEQEYIEELENLEDKSIVIKMKLKFVVLSALLFRPDLKYAAMFLDNALKDEPSNLNFDDKDSIVDLIKTDVAYNKIKELIIEQIKQGVLNGTIETGNDVIFKTGDLLASIHGIKSIDFISTKINENEYQVKMVLFDIYDFKHQNYFKAYIATEKITKIPEKLALTYINNLADEGEYYGVVKNFEIRIKTNDLIKTNSDD